MILIHDLLNFYVLVLVVTALMSWFPASSSGGGLATTQRVLRTMTEPVLRPIRSILPRPRIGGVGIDFSVLIAIVGIEIVNSII